MQSYLGYLKPTIYRNYEADTATMDDVPLGGKVLITNEFLDEADGRFFQRDRDEVIICGQRFVLKGSPPEFDFGLYQVLERI